MLIWPEEARTSARGGSAHAARAPALACLVVGFGASAQRESAREVAVVATPCVNEVVRTSGALPRAGGDDRKWDARRSRVRILVRGRVTVEVAQRSSAQPPAPALPPAPPLPALPAVSLRVPPPHRATSARCAASRGHATSPAAAGCRPATCRHSRPDRRQLLRFTAFTASPASPSRRCRLPPQRSARLRSRPHSGRPPAPPPPTPPTAEAPPDAARPACPPNEVVPPVPPPVRSSTQRSSLQTRPSSHRSSSAQPQFSVPRSHASASSSSPSAHEKTSADKNNPADTNRDRRRELSMSTPRWEARVCSPCVAAPSTTTGTRSGLSYVRQSRHRGKNGPCRGFFRDLTTGGLRNRNAHCGPRY